MNVHVPPNGMNRHRAELGSLVRGVVPVLEVLGYVAVVVLVEHAAHLLHTLLAQSTHVYTARQ